MPYEELSLAELIALRDEMVAKAADPSYTWCDNRSDYLCCNDCGLPYLNEAIAERQRAADAEARAVSVAGRLSWAELQEMAERFGWDD